MFQAYRPFESPLFVMTGVAGAERIAKGRVEDAEAIAEVSQGRPGAARSIHSFRGEAMTMWRSVAMAIGILVTLAGAQCMVVEKMQLIIQRPAESDFAASPLAAMQGAVSRPEVLEVPEWAPWSLLSVGIVMLLYSATMPKPA